MIEISQKDRNAAKRFWEHISAQGKMTEAYQQALTTQEGTKVEGDEAGEYIRHTIEAVFSELESNQVVGNGSVYTTHAEDHSEEEERTTEEWEKSRRKGSGWH